MANLYTPDNRVIEYSNDDEVSPCRCPRQVYSLLLRCSQRSNDTSIKIHDRGIEDGFGRGERELERTGRGIWSEFHQALKFSLRDRRRSVRDSLIRRGF